jgi:hypothetical protein
MTFYCAKLIMQRTGTDNQRCKELKRRLLDRFDKFDGWGDRISIKLDEVHQAPALRVPGESSPNDE